MDLDLLIFRNRVLRRGIVTYGLFRPATWSICILSGIAFSGFEKFKMVTAALEGGRSNDNHEFCFQGAKRSDMDCVELQGCLFADSQKWHFQTEKCSDKSTTILQEGPFAYAQE